MNQLRAGKSISGETCSDHLNSDGTQTILFDIHASSTVIPADVSQVGIDATLTGGESSVFDGARGYFIFRDDSGSYGFDKPIEFKKSADGVVGFRISSIDAFRFVGIQGAPLVAVVAPNPGPPISFADIKFNMTYTYYVLQNDVSYSTYPFATETKPKKTHLLAYRFRAYESVYTALS